MRPPTQRRRFAGSLSCAREVSAVSGDCWAVARRTLDDLGGLNSYFADEAIQTADFSLRALTAGMRHLCTPRVVVRHRMSAPQSGDPGGAADALDRLLLADAWEPLAKEGDAFHNPNFQQTSPGYQE